MATTQKIIEAPFPDTEFTEEDAKARIGEERLIMVKGKITKARLLADGTLELQVTPKK